MILQCSSSELLLVDESLNEIHVDISDLNSVTLMCNLAGYNADATEISWSFHGQPLASGTDGYLISVARGECPPYNTCSVGLLGISNLDSDDIGVYMCSFGNQSQDITLFGNVSVTSIFLYNVLCIRLNMYIQVLW